VVRDIAGGPELIESMDGSAGNYLDFNSEHRVGTLNKHGWLRSKYGWIQPKESGAYEVTQIIARDGLLAAPVEGGFGDDFVRRNRSQLRHAVKCLW